MLHSESRVYVCNTKHLCRLMIRKSIQSLREARRRSACKGNEPKRVTVPIYLSSTYVNTKNSFVC